CCRHLPVDGLERSSGRNAYPSGITPSNIMSPTRSQPGSRTEVSPGARVHTHLLPTQTCPRDDPALDTRITDKKAGLAAADVASLAIRQTQVPAQRLAFRPMHRHS